MERAKKDTRIVRVKRGKAGLGFSLKGGKEHGIPILVCDVERKGATGKPGCGLVQAYMHTPSYHMAERRLAPLGYRAIPKHPQPSPATCVVSSVVHVLLIMVCMVQLKKER